MPAGRFFIEGLRTDSLYTASGLRASQIAAVIGMAAGLAGITLTALRGRKKSGSVENKNIKNL